MFSVFGLRGMYDLSSLTRDQTWIPCIGKWSRSVMSDSLRPVDCSPPSSSVPGILQARVLEWVAFPSPLYWKVKSYSLDHQGSPSKVPLGTCPRDWLHGYSPAWWTVSTWQRCSVHPLGIDLRRNLLPREALKRRQRKAMTRGWAEHLYESFLKEWWYKMSQQGWRTIFKDEGQSGHRKARTQDSPLKGRHEMQWHEEAQSLQTETQAQVGDPW